MQVSMPNMDGPAVGLADFLELGALTSSTGDFPVENLVAALDQERDEESEDIAESDAMAEDLMQRAADEVLNRKKVLGSNYPFDVTDDGALLRCSDAFTQGSYVYLFCLWLSQAVEGGHIGGASLPITSRDRDLFQICATLAAAGFVEGHAHSFGWPRADDSGFVQALVKTYRCLGEGRPKPGPEFPAGVSRATKDAGIDVIAWRDVPDGVCGRLYLLGQAASGRNWRDKSVKHLIDGFHDDFFLEAPPSPPIPALFVPFCLQEWIDSNINSDWKFNENVDSWWRRQTRDFGIIFYRYRMAHYAAKGLELVAASSVVIERAEEFVKVCERVDGVISYLRSDVVE